MSGAHKHPGAQLGRCLAILRALDALPLGASLAVRDLARAHGVTPRTIARDLAALVAAGEPVRRTHAAPGGRARAWLDFDAPAVERAS